jgi:hypothetical protein
MGRSRNRFEQIERRPVDRPGQRRPGLLRGGVGRDESGAHAQPGGIVRRGAELRQPLSGFAVPVQAQEACDETLGIVCRQRSEILLETKHRTVRGFSFSLRHQRFDDAPACAPVLDRHRVRGFEGRAGEPLAQPATRLLRRPRAHSRNRSRHEQRLRLASGQQILRIRADAGEKLLILPARLERFQAQALPFEPTGSPGGRGLKGVDATQGKHLGSGLGECPDVGGRLGALRKGVAMKARGQHQSGKREDGDSCRSRDSACRPAAAQ